MEILCFFLEIYDWSLFLNTQKESVKTPFITQLAKIHISSESNRNLSYRKYNLI